MNGEEKMHNIRLFGGGGGGGVCAMRTRSFIFIFPVAIVWSVVRDETETNLFLERIYSRKKKFSWRATKWNWNEIKWIVRNSNEVQKEVVDLATTTCIFNSAI